MAHVRQTRDFTLGNIGRMRGNGRTPHWAVIVDGASMKYRDNYGHPQPRTFRTEGAARAWAAANLTTALRATEEEAR
jgi:hypothetical protein